MKETILPVLLYIFEHYYVADEENIKSHDDLKNGLNDAGFSDNDIHKALVWLSALNPGSKLVSENIPATSVRIFNSLELERLDTESRGFLLSLEQDKIINARQREIILDRVFALEKKEIDVEDLKWVVLIVLFNQEDIDTDVIRCLIKDRILDEDDDDEEEEEVMH